ncbi:hypothetical protein BJV77DRAFT_701297 [Russula vinacea]|nr:hypothetical protein BJV77DRAFT_701297 [Russula vinacea]
MKFARYLDNAQAPEWKRAYIDYRSLKKRITAIRRAQGVDTGGHVNLSSESESDPLARVFWRQRTAMSKTSRMKATKPMMRPMHAVGGKNNKPIWTLVLIRLGSMS